MDALKNTLMSMGASRLVLMGGILIGLIAFFIYIMARITSPTLDLLYADLDLAESGQIMSKLDTMGIEAEARGGGTEIYVPQDQVARVRMMLAEAGLPSGGSMGYELFDKSDGLGTSGFVQDINHVRALEGELARTIRTITGVQAARVHIVLPKRELFSREKQNASASIFLKMRGSKRLSKQQVTAVQQLVAAAIPGLLAQYITVVDDQGTLLARGDGDLATMGTATVAEEMRQNFERSMASNLESLLASSLGPGKARVEVTAKLNYDKMTENSEEYNPEGQVVRSSQTNKETSEEGGAAPAFAPQTVNPAAQAQPGGAPNRNSTNRTSETTNYEISKKVRTIVREGGELERLSVAVLVDGDYSTAADGKKTYKPRSDDELSKIKTLIKSAIGFNEARGDSVEVINMAFYKPGDELEGEDSGILMGLTQEDIYKIIEVIVFGVVGLLVLLLVVRPVINRLLDGNVGNSVKQNAMGIFSQAQAGYQGGSGGGGMPTPNMLPGGGGGMAPPPGYNQLPGMPMPQGIQLGGGGGAGPLQVGGGGEVEDLLNKVEGQVKGSTVKQIEQIVEKHPEESASIIRSWMHQEE